jgi:hypothetical protein
MWLPASVLLVAQLLVGKRKADINVDAGRSSERT